MSQWNAISGLTNATSIELQEALGITKFPTEFSWHQMIGGLLLQGNKEVGLAGDAIKSINFTAPYQKQVLGIFLTPISSTIDGGGAAHSFAVANLTLTGFDLVNDSGTDSEYFWLAIGN